MPEVIPPWRYVQWIVGRRPDKAQPLKRTTRPHSHSGPINLQNTKQYSLTIVPESLREANSDWFHPSCNGLITPCPHSRKILGYDFQTRIFSKQDVTSLYLVHLSLVIIKYEDLIQMDMEYMCTIKQAYFN